MNGHRAHAQGVPTARIAATLVRCPLPGASCHEAHYHPQKPRLCVLCSDRRRRIDFAIRLPYGTPADRVLALLLEVAKRDPRVMAHAEPEALFTAFGDTALEFPLRFWTEESRSMRVRSDLGVAVQDALRETNIEVSWKQPQSLRGPASSEK